MLGMNIRAYTDLFVQVSSAKLSDSLWPWADPQTIDFASVLNVVPHPAESILFADESVILQLNIRLDQQSTIYTR